MHSCNSFTDVKTCLKKLRYYYNYIYNMIIIMDIMPISYRRFISIIWSNVSNAAISNNTRWGSCVLLYTYI